MLVERVSTGRRAQSDIRALRKGEKKGRREDVSPTAARLCASRRGPGTRMALFLAPTAPFTARPQPCPPSSQQPFACSTQYRSSEFTPSWGRQGTLRLSTMPSARSGRSGTARHHRFASATRHVRSMSLCLHLLQERVPCE